MRIAQEKNTCCGCSACAAVCPKQAITMKKDKEGFFYPHIDEETCVHCHLCEQACLFLSGYQGLADGFVQQYFAVQQKDLSERRKSQSGGIGASLMRATLVHGGIVYGVILDDAFCVHHTRVTALTDLDGLCGSKYVHSDLRNSYTQVKEDLLAGQQVLFTGTACQTAGLRNFLHVAHVPETHLLTMDLVCHGGPSPEIFAACRQEILRRHPGKMESIDFRNKRRFGWHSHELTAVIDGKEVHENAYTNLFYSHLILRPSCYHCPMTNLNRSSDITVCDCWGIERVLPDFDDNQGTSLVMLNSTKGRQAFAMVKDELNLHDIAIEDVLQPQMQYPNPCPKNRDAFWKDYQQKGISYVIAKYVPGNHGFWWHVRKTLRPVKRWLKQVIQ